MADSVASSDEDQAVTIETINNLEREMLEAAQNLEFERAADMRDEIHELKRLLRQRGKISRGEYVKSKRTASMKKKRR